MTTLELIAKWLNRLPEVTEVKVEDGQVYFWTTHDPDTYDFSDDFLQNIEFSLHQKFGMNWSAQGNDCEGCLNEWCISPR